MKTTFNVEFFDLKNNWNDSINIDAVDETEAKNAARKMMGRGFVNFRAFAV